MNSDTGAAYGQLPPRPWTWKEVLQFADRSEEPTGEAPRKPPGYALAAADGTPLLRVDGGRGSPEVLDPAIGTWSPRPVGPVAELLAMAPELAVEAVTLSEDAEIAYLSGRHDGTEEERLNAADTAAAVGFWRDQLAERTGQLWEARHLAVTLWWRHNRPDPSSQPVGRPASWLDDGSGTEPAIPAVPDPPDTLGVTALDRLAEVEDARDRYRRDLDQLSDHLLVQQGELVEARRLVRDAAELLPARADESASPDTWAALAQWRDRLPPWVSGDGA